MIRGEQALSTLKFLSTRNVDFSATGEILSRRIREYFDLEVLVCFSSSLHTPASTDTLFVCYAGARPRDALVLSEAALTARHHILAQLTPDDLDDRNLLSPRVILATSDDVDEETADAVAALADDLIKRLIQRQRARIRREIISAKVQSSDLSSFLHRLLRGPVLTLIGIEAASVFVLDPRSGLLRLRGSSGLKSGKPQSDIFFGSHDESKVWRVFSDKRPLNEYSETEPLAEGRSAEKLAASPWARGYWPIQLQLGDTPDIDSWARTPCVGALRVVNKTIAGTVRRLPFSWFELAAMEFFCEVLYVMVDAYNDADAAGFRKEQAFHGAMGVVDGLAKSVDRARKLLFEIPPYDPIVRRLFDVTPVKNAPNYDPLIVRRFLDTAYACAKDIAFQIERANYEFSGDRGAVTRALVTKVVKPAVDVIPDICIANSNNSPFGVTNVLAFLHDNKLPPAVRGSEDALFSVFLNVFENAVKYAEKRSRIQIDIDVEVRREFVIFRIRDYGIGVGPDEEERIFSQGYRSDRAIDHAPRGSGLGLSWCRSILRFYGGSISAKRKEPGLEITIQLRVAEPYRPGGTIGEAVSDLGR